METKAACIKPNYPGTRLYESGDVADLSEIDYKSRHCWEIGGVKLSDIKELDDERFYLVKGESADAKAIGKKMKEEIKAIEGKNTSLEAENAELKLKLAKLEGKKEKAKGPEKDVEDIISATQKDDAGDSDESEIF